MRYREFLKSATYKLCESGSESPDLDARIILEKATKQDDVYTLTHPDFPLTNQQYSRARRLLKRRLKGEPIAYITGHKEFYGLDFSVNKNVLIPRPESEWLVEHSLDCIKYHVSSIKEAQKDLNEKAMIHNTKYKILDLGAGSGCIIISIAKKLSLQASRLSPKFYATDISKKALYVARKNAKKILFEDEGRELPGSNSSRWCSNNINIGFYQSDLFSNPRLPKKFNLIVANLPYVPLPNTKYQIPNTLSFEPQNAIFANDNGTAIIKRFLLEARNRIEPGGCILIELDPRNASELLLFAKNNYHNAKIELTKDLAGFDRYLSINLIA